MAKGKQRAWNNLDGLYRDVEDARRHAEHGTSEEGSHAWERWLELIDIAMYSLSGRDDDDMVDIADDGDGPDEDAEGPDDGPQQLELPTEGRVGTPVAARHASRTAKNRAHDVAGTLPVSNRAPTFGAKGDRRRGT